MHNPNNPNSAFGRQNRGPMAFAAIGCFMSAFFFFFSGIFMTAFGSGFDDGFRLVYGNITVHELSCSGTQVVGVIFLVLAVGLTCTGIFFFLRAKKQHEEYVTQTAGTQPQQNVPVVSGMPPPGYYGEAQPVQPPAPGTNGQPYPQAPQPYPQAPQPYPQAQPYPPTSQPYTQYPQAASSSQYPNESQPITDEKAPPPPSYDAAVSNMGVQPSAPPTEDKT